VVAATFAGLANYFSSPSWRYEEEDDDGVDANEKIKNRPPQAEVTSRVYFDIAIDQRPVGRIIIGLHGNVVPRTAKNFETICRGGQKIGNIQMTYDGSNFHRIIPGFMIQGGEKPGRSIYSSLHVDGRFPDENFQLKHIGPGILSMANAGKDTNGSQFFITTARTSHLDGKHVVFGVVEDGYDVVKEIEACGSSSGKPLRKVVITKSGVLENDA